MKKILITGGSGFIGTNLATLYKGKGYNVLNLDVRPPRDEAHLPCWKKVDILDRADLSAAIGEFDPHYCFHLAARTDLLGRSSDEYAANTVGTSNVISAVSTLKTLERIIFASSRLVCRIGYQPRNDSDYCPTTMYGESKVKVERIVRSAENLPHSWLIVRPTSIWGPWFGVPYNIFFRSIAKGRYFHPGSGVIRKSFGYVGNTVFQLDQLMRAPSSDVNKKTFYLADHQPTDIRELANLIQAEMAARPIRTVPVPVLKMAALIGDFTKAAGWKEPPLTSFRLDNLVTNMVHDLGPVEKIVGQLPFSLLQGVRETVAWMRDTRTRSGYAAAA